MNPRASMPTTLSTLPRPKWTTVSSITDEKPTSSASSGVMSLKTIPGLGKSGTSRMRARRRWMSMGTVAVLLSGLAPAALGRAGLLAPGRLAALLVRAWLLGLAAGRRRGGHGRLGLGGLLQLLIVVVGQLGLGFGRGRRGAPVAGRGRAAGAPGRAGGGPDRALGALGGRALGGQALDPGPELGVAGLLLLPHGDQRRGDEDRGVGAGGHAHEQGQGQVLEGLGPEQVG